MGVSVMEITLGMAGIFIVGIMILFFMIAGDDEQPQRLPEGLYKYMVIFTIEGKEKNYVLYAKDDKDAEASMAQIIKGRDNQIDFSAHVHVISIKRMK
jgi:hypothetical protein